METEIAFAHRSRQPGFPIAVPAAYFADYHHAGQTGMLITQTIDFRSGEIEPQLEKCMDHLIEDPLPYYRKILRALARIAAAHSSCMLPQDNVNSVNRRDTGAFA